MTIIAVRFTDYKISRHHGKDTTQIVWLATRVTAAHVCIQLNKQEHGGRKEALICLAVVSSVEVAATALNSVLIYDIAVNIRVQERNSMRKFNDPMVIVYTVAAYLRDYLYLWFICYIWADYVAKRNKLDSMFWPPLHRMLFPMNSQIKRMSPWLYEGKEPRYHPKSTKVYSREQYSNNVAWA